MWKVSNNVWPTDEPYGQEYEYQPTLSPDNNEKSVQKWKYTKGKNDKLVSIMEIKWKQKM